MVDINLNIGTSVVRQDTQANWGNVNPVLLRGEFAYESDTGRFKIGDGVRRASALPYGAGATGEPGADGVDGINGASAYEVALSLGFAGTEAAWVATLVGPPGPPGDDGAPGIDGIIGFDGASAYEIAVANGFVGTESEWLASLGSSQTAESVPFTSSASIPETDVQAAIEYVYSNASPLISLNQGTSYFNVAANYMYIVFGTTDNWYAVRYREIDEATTIQPGVPASSLGELEALSYS